MPWDYALVLAAVFYGVSTLLARRQISKSPAWPLLLKEAATVAVLYSIWMLAGKLSAFSIEPAVDRGLQIWDVERALFLPSEATLQGQLLPHPFLVKTANVYYATAHISGMGVFLVWMFVRHRQLYSRWRNSLAAMTAISLAIQLYPVAPPRLIPELAMVDTAVLYGQSVYSTLGAASEGQLQAMPSLHIGWALLIGLAAYSSSDSVFRWIGPAHFVLTLYVVVVTGNHYWMDGIVVGLILALVFPIFYWLDQKNAKTSKIACP